MILILGILTGLGCIGLAAAFRRPKERLARTLDRLGFDLADAGSFTRDELVTPLAIDTANSAKLTDRIGTSVATRVIASGRCPEWLMQQLRLCEEPLAIVCSEMALGFLAAPAVVIAVLGLASLVGSPLPMAIPLWLGIAIAGCAAGLPLLSLRSRAKDRRRHLIQATASLVDLVVLGLSAGMGIEGALSAATQVSNDWAMRKFATALHWARDSKKPPWEALSRLGQELGVSPLVEVATSAGLAGREGAKIRQSLTAKAASLRSHELAEAEKEANTTTERMFLPGILLLTGFLVLIGYPATMRILTGL